MEWRRQIATLQLIGRHQYGCITFAVSNMPRRGDHEFAVSAPFLRPHLQLHCGGAPTLANEPQSIPPRCGQAEVQIGLRSEGHEKILDYFAFAPVPAIIAADAFSVPSDCFFARTTTFAPGASLA
jgi:hypothetical protein